MKSEGVCERPRMMAGITAGQSRRIRVSSRQPLPSEPVRPISLSLYVSFSLTRLLRRGMALQTLDGHTNVVTSVCATTDRRYVISGSFDDSVRVWSLADGSLVRTLNGHTDTVRSVHTTTDGRYIISGSVDNSVRVWSLADGSLVRTLNGHTNTVRSVHATTDGRYIISGSVDNSVRVWSLADGSLVRTLNGHANYVLSVHATTDGRYIISGSFDKSVRVWSSGIAPAVAPPPPAGSGSEDVQCVGERTREQRDAEGRKRAIDLNSESERKRAKLAIETRVAKARSLCDAAINTKYMQLIRPSLDEYAHDKIDEAELARRKRAAREQAAAEHPPLASLDGVYRVYVAKAAARVAAEKALAAAEADEDEAMAAVEAALLSIEGQAAGPSGAAKRE